MHLSKGESEVQAASYDKFVVRPLDSCNRRFHEFAQDENRTPPSLTFHKD